MIDRLRTEIETWVFDLDHTLYPPDQRLFEQIEPRMADWMMDTLAVSADEANRMRFEYWRDHGTTLAGLMRNHGVAPDGYLEHVHDIDFTVLTPDPDLRHAINALPGRKIIYTNGTAPYAKNVIKGLHLEGTFDAIYGVEHAEFHPKPDRVAFESVFAQDGFDPTRAAMFEDDPRNLEVPHAMGLSTVHVAPAPTPRPFIQHHTTNLRGFLTQLMA